MALTITKNDLDSVYGKTYTDLVKITKQDFEKVYGSSQTTTQPTKTKTPKYSTVNGEIEIPYYIKNQGVYDLSEKTKFDYFADSVTKGAVGSIAQVGDSLKQSLTGETGKADRALYDFTMESAYNPSKANQLKGYIAQKQTADRSTSLNTDTFGYKMLDSSQKDMQKVTEGMSDTGRFLTNVAGSVAQNALVSPLAFISPSLAAGVMATSAAGHSIKQQADSGKTLKEANFRGVVDGLIEYGLGKIGIESYLDNILGNGNVLKNIAKSALSEGSEESLSYIANYILDKISGDPDAKFDLKEFGLNTLAGGLAGGALGAGGAAIGSIGRNMGTDPYYAAYSKAMDKEMLLDSKYSIGESISEKIFPNLETNTIKFFQPNFDIDNESNVQYYRPIEYDENDSIITKYNNKGFTATKISSYKHKNIYVSDSLRVNNLKSDINEDYFNIKAAKLKPRDIHFVNTMIDKSVNLVKGKTNYEYPTIIICQSSELTTESKIVPALYDADNNTLKLSVDICSKKQPLILSDELSQLTCPNDYRSTYIHEMFHWLDANRYKEIYGTSKGYLDANNKECKKQVEKLVENGYNIEDISKYAYTSYVQGLYYETWTEYRTKQILKGK